MKKFKKIRTRIAPSPTGIPHIGNTRTALFDFLFSRHHKGDFILRIEDTDRARLVPESEKALYEILDWLGLKWNEKYIQSERLEIYQQYSEKLLKEDKAYKFEGAVKFRMPKTGTTKWEDAVGNKKIEFKNENQEDFVIIKSDGYPTYNFANVIDDHLMSITHVIRGEEFISSTPKHIQLYKSFDWEVPVFAHLPVIVGPDHQKLSKRHGAKSVIDYRKEGYLKEALLNFMALLGWNPGEDREIMTLDEMIKLFDLKDVNTSSPVFDEKKLNWMNGVYIRKLSVDELTEKILKFDPKFKKIDPDLLKKLVVLAQTRINTLGDFSGLIEPVLEKPKIQLSKKEIQIREELAGNLVKVEIWNSDSIFSEMKKMLDKEKIKMNVFYKIILGRERGLPLPQLLELLGKEKSIKMLLLDRK